MGIPARIEIFYIHIIDLFNKVEYLFKLVSADGAGHDFAAIDDFASDEGWLGYPSELAES